MSGDDEGQGFWTGTNALLTGLVVLLTAGAVLMVVLFKTGVSGDDDHLGYTTDYSDAVGMLEHE
ncbi:MAG TPA: hypothetical protein VFV89_01690 [Nocardioides sp.]|uniref:hypothetical protein n=1 Tax=Nocardioides sp. TaxID=35761 RepID=UPI002E3116F4|nr:hypothetical protein [Nocardioides sp.]HEX5086487.1 hypothetical protein [Nocardioides sp.]